MKKQIGLVAFVLVLALSATTAVAQTCPTPGTGPYFFNTLIYYDYSPHPSCVSYGSGLTGAQMCNGISGWEATGTGLAQTSYTFTATPYNATIWSAGAYVTLNDPNDSMYNSVEMWAVVTHNGVTTYTLLFYYDGTDGDLDCMPLSGGFAVQENDTVTIETYTYRSNTNTTIQVSSPLINAVVQQ